MRCFEGNEFERIGHLLFRHDPTRLNVVRFNCRLVRFRGVGSPFRGTAIRAWPSCIHGGLFIEGPSFEFVIFLAFQAFAFLSDMKGCPKWTLSPLRKPSHSALPTCR